MVKKTGKATKAKDRKSRAPSNRVGERGEKQFDAAAADYGLIAAPIKNDYGFDFICQVDEDPSAVKPSSLHGGLVGVAVRATTNAEGRVKLWRADADALLRAQFVTMVALVHLPKKGASSISVRVLDETFRKELGVFMSGSKASVSYTPDAFVPISEVRKVLEPALKPNFVQESRLAAMMSGLESVIPGVRLRVLQEANGSWTLVTADNLFSIFATGGQQAEDARYLTAFGSPSRMEDRLRELDVAPGLVASLDGLPEGVVIYGATEHEETPWIAVDSEGESVCTFVSAETPDHTGWRHAAGWSLVISRPVLREGHYVHELRAFADPDAETALRDEPDLDAFLRRCTKDARIGKQAWAELPFEAWGFEDMPRYNKFAEWLFDIHVSTSLSVPIAYLRDAHDDETMRTLHWLSALHRDQANPGLRLGFMLGQASGTPDVPCEFVVPVLANTAQVSLLAMLRCEGRLAADPEGLLAGLKILRVKEFTVEVQPRLDKASPFPEFLFNEDLVVAPTDAGWDIIGGAEYPDALHRFEVVDLP